jgi:UDP-N-acetylmuramoyl-L-alanyl-D-glutamate--2,6-diaminopimelate ligase
MDSILRLVKKLIPKNLFEKAQPAYHYLLAFFGAVRYGFPANKIKVIFITGTKGKSSTTEILNAVLEGAGKKTAMLGTIRFKIGDKVWANKFKMTTPGRFFIQRFLRQESHGSFENYLAAKLSLATALERSNKKHRVIVTNGDDKESHKFVAVDVEEKKLFKLKDAEPYMLDHYGLYLTYKGKYLRSHLQGVFNIYNILAALTYASTQGVTPDQAQEGLNKLTGIAGRVQKITLPETNPLSKKQDFTVVVDYAHTADSLEKMYRVFNDSKKIGVLGNTGGGRDKWKRPEMAKVADAYCSHIILTNEDPYDEDPMQILKDMIPGIKYNPYEIVLDRREAIHKAISLAHRGDTVIISGKGTDPYIMGPNGKKTPWSDAQVATEELEKVLKERNQ